ncbi:MAG: flavodoxin-dependent (E)-4-hydroxy-3-methylbut-2-enyl-diphosphate synthase [Alphaproteobacteria bacterium]|nr:flavodoxin-dependent (E)-4-hydroxy-3-methylbut-2-enyl-diphosphate synthase [Alphaproteobacteria bacterium]
MIVSPPADDALTATVTPSLPIDLVTPFARRRTSHVAIGKVDIGHAHQISVQSMTNTDTRDVPGTLDQIRALSVAGADIVRVSCPDDESIEGFKHLVRESTVPLVADIHFQYKLAIKAVEAGAAGLRINPGNIGNATRVREVARAAKDHGCPIRVGVNAGSLERRLLEMHGKPNAEALVQSALDGAALLESVGFSAIKISAKASSVPLAVDAYRRLGVACSYPLHLGITEAGSLNYGSTASAVGLGILLGEGIGDTIRVSLAADPVNEIRVGFDLLRSLGLRNRGVKVIACPSCARQQFDVIATVATIEQALAHITQPLTVSIIGCVVNGPGEAKMSDIGLTGGGKGHHQLYLRGEAAARINTDEILGRLVAMVEEMISTQSSHDEEHA